MNAADAVRELKGDEIIATLLHPDTSAIVKRYVKESGSENETLISKIIS